jgi:hypothetical protein
MQRCTQCGAASPDNAQSCQNCGHPFNKGSQQKKQRSFLAGLLLLLGIRRNPQTGSLGCAPIPTISVALVAVAIIGVMVGPVLKLLPPFAPGLSVSGPVVPGGTIVVHGTNFPAGSRINLTLDGTSITLASTSGSITVGSSGTFNAQVSIPGSWQPNSQHTIRAQAIGQDGSVQTQAQQTVAVGVEPTATLDGVGFCRSTDCSTSTSSCAASTAGTGNDLTFTLPGAAPSPMCVVRNDGCYIKSSPSPSDYHFSVLGTVNGTLYTFMFVIGSLGPNGLQGYSGPGTYTGDGGVALIVGDYSKVTGTVSEWLTFTGTVTVNGGETSGNVDALMHSNANGTGQAVQVTGNWACSTLQRK